MDLYCGDCLDYMKSLSDNSIDLICTDPPYDVHVEAKAGSFGRAFDNNVSWGQQNTIDHIINGYDIDAYNKEFVRIMRGINIYLWCNKAQIPQ